MARTRRPTPTRGTPRTLADLNAGPGWRWTTLPVFVALTGGFVLGFEVASIGIGIEPSGWAQFIGYGGLLLFGFGLSRLWSWYVNRWIMRRQARAGKLDKATPASGKPARPASATGAPAPGTVQTRLGKKRR